MITSFTHVVAIWYFIPFYARIIFHCTDEPHSVYSFTKWNEYSLFGLFPPLATMNHAALSNHPYKYLCGHMFLFLLSLYQGVEFLAQMVTWFLSFWWTASLFPKMVHHFIFPPAVLECSAFSTSLPVVIWLFDSSHPSGYKMVYYCGFNVYFSND